MSTLKEFVEALPEKIKKTGIADEDPGELLLNAGQLQMYFSQGSLRYISTGSNELIRTIYASVRDRNWMTIAPLIRDQKIEKSESSFRITFSCLYQSGEINFSAEYVIEGRDDSSVVFTMDGIALEKFEKNRIGLCVLHPIRNCAGINCIVEHSDGSSEQSAFPEEVSPHQIFSDIKSLNWISDKTYCKLDFEGDIFETEDQRNWTDASYKTYSTPLSIPFPAILEKGERIFQRVSLNVKESFIKPEAVSNRIIVKLFPEESFRLPSIGICQTSRSRPLTAAETKIIRALRFDHYRVDLHLHWKGWQFNAERGCQEASDLGFRLVLALFFDDNMFEQINNFKDWYLRRRLFVESIFIYHKSLPSTPDSLAKEIIPVLREKNPDVRIATGTNANFAQLNRNRPGDTRNDSICYSIHPQEHASDNLTLVENLEGQAYSVLSAKGIAGNKGIFISPVTIQRRFNANNDYIEIHHLTKEPPMQIDSRQMSLFGACWTAISLKYLCEKRAESITYYETVGERGVFQGEFDSAWPGYFPAVKGMIFPVYHVFRFLTENKDMKLVKSISSNPLLVDCLALSDGKQARIILVNFSGSAVTLQLECCSGLFRMRTLSAASFSEAALNFRWTGIENEKTIKSQNTFELEPCSLNFIEGWRKH
jgi:D-apionolactonase